MSKVFKIFLNALPILLMLTLIPFVDNDYLLCALYIVIIVTALFIKRERGDHAIFAVGFVTMIICECLFTSTHVEVFVRNSLFGLMPIWLPFLWGYGFIGIRRLLEILRLYRN